MSAPPSADNQSGTTVTGTLTRRWTRGAESGGVLEVDGKSLTVTGLLPAAPVGATLHAELSGHTLIHAERVVTSGEIDLAFYGLMTGIQRAGALALTRRWGDSASQMVAAATRGTPPPPPAAPSVVRAMCHHARRQARLRQTLSDLSETGLWPEHAARLLAAQGAGATAFVRGNPYLAVQYGVPLEVLDTMARRLGISAFDPRRGSALALALVNEAAADGHTGLPRGVLAGKLTEQHALESTEIGAALKAACAGGLLEEDAGWLYTPQALRTERWLAGDVIRVMEADITALGPAPSERLSEDQRAAVGLACREALCVITGGPGTGKTTTIGAVITSLEAAGLTTLLCAPTGKAAARLEQATGRAALTLHRLLGHDGTHFGSGMLQAGAVVVDEASMLSNELLGALLRCVPDGGRVILVGDPDQLPPVDPGWPLPALIGRVPAARLSRVHRQGASSPVLELAGMLIGGERPASTGVAFTETGSAREVVALAHAHITADGPPIILSAGRNGALGTRALNAAMQQNFNPGSGALRPGDPVIVTVNDRQSGLMNGQTGVVLSAGHTVEAEFGGEAHRFTLNGPLELAYALSVHRAQGSEWNAVMVCLSPEHARLLTRTLAYTAVTRARTTLIACGLRAAWDTCAATPQPARHSRLRERLS
ncbi:AAA family ATPase [Deinococcus marmoris]|uniref:RecD-like DNA helicase YrrC n=1 Tax=Deinococcus marmoris TaxID=249408 RepID=A0A1U7NTZ9_9DEIO|nr:AAA family ATPase [Deinococcus marmoris]OLV16390.1 RecD-like DNA helicase YrrC [Deinococcus marmoris]